MLVMYDTNFLSLVCFQLISASVYLICDQYSWIPDHKTNTYCNVRYFGNLLCFVQKYYTMRSQRVPWESMVLVKVKSTFFRKQNISFSSYILFKFFLKFKVLFLGIALKCNELQIYTKHASSAKKGYQDHTKYGYFRIGNH
jgi:hypothetical protein